MNNEIFRNDYTAPSFSIDNVHLTFQLNDNKTRVINKSCYTANSAVKKPVSEIFLHGEELELISLKLNDIKLEADRYEITDKGLLITNIPSVFTLEIVTETNPVDNKSLEGLYKSSGMFCTQCEAEGFRKITFYLDRPDVLAKFTTRIEADVKYPVLLSNGNLIDKGQLGDNRHYAEWNDPFPKPSYLFALVAGDLVCIKDKFVTASGKNIAIEFFVEEQNKDQCEHAISSLKKSMKWDEEVFGLEYDLDIYMVVAVNDFNMGAMENKGLNIFNSKYVLAAADTATDQDYLGVEAVIAHEYFHNWTGNRVTCRDWFQLSLKEGLTVYRDQEFSADMNSRAVQRIEDVRVLRTYQFREDAGPMAHPVRPESFVEINNFYTSTIYNKGAEVIRMMQNILGRKKFRQGMDLYISRHDGEAVTCEDFVVAMEDATCVDLKQFRRWYSQAGTPILEVETKFDQHDETFTLKIKQSCHATPGQNTKKPFHIPIKIGLLDINGKDISLNCYAFKDGMIQLQQEEQEFVFTGIKSLPCVSLLRQFSAPVKIKPFHKQEELAFLMANDTDLFNRWDSANTLSMAIILAIVDDLQKNIQPVLPPFYIDAVRAVLNDKTSDKSLLAYIMDLPSEVYIAQQMDVIDPDNIHFAKKFVIQELARELQSELIQVYKENNSEAIYDILPSSMSARNIKNVCLSYLLKAKEVLPDIIQLCLDQFHANNNMTDVFSALTYLVNARADEANELLDNFYSKWQGNHLVEDKWFALQAMISHKDTLSNVKELMSHPAFSIKNPNKVRSLIGVFCGANQFCFHDLSGLGYEFLASQIIELDSFNPQIAARMVSPFANWKKYDSKRQELIKKQLERIKKVPEISGDLNEMVTKIMVN